MGAADAGGTELGPHLGVFEKQSDGIGEFGWVFRVADEKAVVVGPDDIRDATDAGADHRGSASSCFEERAAHGFDVGHLLTHGMVPRRLHVGVAGLVVLSEPGLVHASGEVDGAGEFQCVCQAAEVGFLRAITDGEVTDDGLMFAKQGDRALNGIESFFGHEISGGDDHEFVWLDSEGGAQGGAVCGREEGGTIHSADDGADAVLGDAFPAQGRGGPLAIGDDGAASCQLGDHIGFALRPFPGRKGTSHCGHGDPVENAVERQIAAAPWAEEVIADDTLNDRKFSRQWDGGQTGGAGVNDIAALRPGQLQEGSGIPAGRRHAKNRPDVKTMGIGGFSQRLRDRHHNPMGTRQMAGNMPCMLSHAPEMLWGELIRDNKNGHAER